MSETDPHVHPQLARVIRRCLQKRKEQRFQSAADLAFELEALSEQSELLPSAALTGGNRIRAQFVLIIATVALLIAIVWFSLRTPAGEDSVAITRFQVPLPENATFIPAAEIKRRAYRRFPSALHDTPQSAAQQPALSPDFHPSTGRRKRGHSQLFGIFYLPYSQAIAAIEGEKIWI